MSGQVPPRSFPQELLERVLANNDFEQNDIDQLCQLEEKTWHDFKGSEGLRLDDKGARKKAAQDLRQDVTAFANSDGGLLVFGINDNRERSPNPVHAEAEKWATDVIRPLVEAGMPVPRILLKDDLMVIAVARSSQLVPLPHEGSVAYFMRINDTTAKVPEFLLTDLFYGRRAHAEFVIRDCYAQWTVDSSVKTPSFGLHLNIANESPQWVEDCRFYIVGCSLSFPGPVPNFAASAVANELPADDRLGFHTLTVQQIGSQAAVSRDPVSLPPLCNAQLTAGVRPPEKADANRARWRGGLVVVPKGSRMLWFQVDVDMDIVATRNERGAYNPPANSRFPVRVEPTLSERPIISWSATP